MPYNFQEEDESVSCNILLLFYAHVVFILYTTLFSDFSIYNNNILFTFAKVVYRKVCHMYVPLVLLVRYIFHPVCCLAVPCNN